MCWVSKKSEVKRAKEDIPVFKILRPSDNKLFSYYHDFEYIKDKEYIGNKLNVKEIASSYYILEGFHSYSMDCKMHRAITFDGCPVLAITYNNYYIGKYFPPYIKASCVIPKGSIYGLNECGEYVSDSIKIISEHVLEK